MTKIKEALSNEEKDHLRTYGRVDEKGQAFIITEKGNLWIRKWLLETKHLNNIGLKMNGCQKRIKGTKNY